MVIVFYCDSLMVSLVQEYYRDLARHFYRNHKVWILVVQNGDIEPFYKRIE
jgi:hypothetical protein